MTLMDMSGPVPVGGVQNATIIECPRCNKMVIIPAGLILRIPNTPDGDYCHVTVDGKTGKEFKRG